MYALYAYTSAEVYFHSTRGVNYSHKKKKKKREKWNINNPRPVYYPSRPRIVIRNSFRDIYLPSNGTHFGITGHRAVLWLECKMGRRTVRVRQHVIETRAANDLVTESASPPLLLTIHSRWEIADVNAILWQTRIDPGPADTRARVSAWLKLSASVNQADWIGDRIIGGNVRFPSPSCRLFPSPPLSRTR